MATTRVEWEESPCDEPAPIELVRRLKADYETNQRDEDKAGDVDDAIYYQGRMDSLADVLYSLGWKVRRD